MSLDLIKTSHLPSVVIKNINNHHFEDSLVYGLVIQDNDLSFLVILHAYVFLSIVITHEI